MSEKAIFSLFAGKFRSHLLDVVYGIKRADRPLFLPFKGVFWYENLNLEALFFAPKSQEFALLADKESQEP